MLVVADAKTFYAIRFQPTSELRGPHQGAAFFFFQSRLEIVWQTDQFQAPVKKHERPEGVSQRSSIFQKQLRKSQSRVFVVVIPRRYPENRNPRRQGILFPSRVPHPRESNLWEATARLAEVGSANRDGNPVSLHWCI